VDVVAEWAADFPNSVVGFVPAAADGFDHGVEEADVLGGEWCAGFGEEGDQVGDNAEDVELDLLAGAVADADWAAFAVAG
jgi:hypothetical protein